MPRAPLREATQKLEETARDSSFWGETSETLFILLNVWLISMKLLPLVSGTIMKV